MGCVKSKKEVIDQHPNIFRVANLDDDYKELYIGLLQVTENELILRKKKETITWPLHSLRRYGYRDDIFSFESGTRCQTGPGIFTFRCQRAPILSETVQNQIMRKNYTAKPGPIVGQRKLSSQVFNQYENAGPADNKTYDGPMSYFQDADTSLPIFIKQEHNNNLSRDLAVLRSSLQQECALKTIKEIEEERKFLEKQDIEKNANYIKPASDEDSKFEFELIYNTYTELQVKNFQPIIDRTYMNIESDSEPDLNKNNEILEDNQSNVVNLKQDLNLYANLPSDGSTDSMNNVRQKFSESDTHTSLSPIEEMEVKYAVLELDIDSNKEMKDIVSSESQSDNNKTEIDISTSSLVRTRVVSQTSLEKGFTMSAVGDASPPPTGYTTIDLYKTVALAEQTDDVKSDESRKTNK